MIDPHTFAIDIAKEAGELLMTHYGSSRKLDWADRIHLKNFVDGESDSLIRGKIAKAFPSHNVLSEENKPVLTGSSLTWIIDPLDGTIPYSYGMSNHFGVCIALAKGSEPIIGVIYAPLRDELYSAQKGKGAFCNGAPINPLSETEIAHTVMGLDSGKESEGFRRAELSDYLTPLLSDKGISCPVSYGCASLPLAFVASGRLHAYMALSLEPWDMAAAAVINREVGNPVTNLRGEEWTTNDPSILTANPILHRKLLEIIQNK